jgi:hypothetical protein
MSNTVEEEVVPNVGVDWAYRTALWCALAPGGEIAGDGRIATNRDGLARLVLELGDEVRACVEMMSGALWVRDELVACSWQVRVADARKPTESVGAGKGVGVVEAASQDARARPTS